MTELHYIKYSWKNFRIHLPDLEKWLRDNIGESYLGNSSDQNNITLWFKEDLSPAQRNSIESHFDMMSPDGELAKSNHEKNLAEAEDIARNNLAHIDINQMIPAEKKLFMGQPLTANDREALLAKYPVNNN